GVCSAGGALRCGCNTLGGGEPLYAPVEHRGAALVYGWDPKMAALSHRSCVLWALGRIDQAVEVSRQAVEHARALGHPLSLAHAMYFSAWIRQCRREPEACRKEAEALITHATEEGIPFLKFNGLALRGWALVEHGELERGIADLGESLGASIIGGSLGQTPHLASLAAALARAGRLAEARQRLDECKALTATGERFHEPEIHRLDAELILTESGGAGGAPPRARGPAGRPRPPAIESAHPQGARAPGRPAP